MILLFFLNTIDFLNIIDSLIIIDFFLKKILNTIDSFKDTIDCLNIFTFFGIFFHFRTDLHACMGVGEPAWLGLEAAGEVCCFFLLCHWLWIACRGGMLLLSVLPLAIDRM